MAHSGDSGGENPHRCERCLFLVRKRFNAERLVRRIDDLARENDWQGCDETRDRHRKKPVARVLRAGLESRENAARRDGERASGGHSQGGSPLERFLSTLGMLAAIAPLLGLLGTVTGMIDTFTVITLHGVGDPRLMSGGISETLVTTMLGLSAAIPLMLCHTLLNRAVGRHIAEMDNLTILKAEPSGLFEESVEPSVSRSRFNPGTVGGMPVRTWVETTVRFELEG